jgi:hypothetical protein
MQDLPISPRVYALVFRADGCAQCKLLHPKATALSPSFVHRGILPVLLDRTDSESWQRSREEAQALGVRSLADRVEGTGFIELVDVHTRQSLGRISAVMSEGQMSAIFEEALLLAESSLEGRAGDVAPPHWPSR